MKLRINTSIAAISCLTSMASAVLVADGSPCSSKCGNVLTQTFPSDMSCSASEYEQPAGVVFQGCVECEMTSSFANEKGETDMKWMLYNLRYSISYCLFGEPDHEDWNDNPCRTETACGGLQEAIQFSDLKTNTTALGYCQKWDEGLVSQCNSCLKNGQEFFGLKNFITILDAACLQKPAVGTLVAIEGNPFSPEQVNITEPEYLGDFDEYSQGGFGLGAKVGVAIGSILVLVAIIGLCIVWAGKKRRRAFLRKLEEQHGRDGWPHPRNGVDMFETPISQKPLAGWTDSPLTPSEKQFPRYFSPYSSQYNSPTSATDPPQHFQWPDKSQAQQMTIGVALGGENKPTLLKDGSSVKGKEREEIELTEVDSRGNKYFPKAPNAPVLHHPGYGRGDPNRMPGI